MNRSDWTGRIDAKDGALGLRWHQIVQPLQADDPAGVVLLGFASDAGVARNQGRIGAAEGPAALRRALANSAIHRVRKTPVYDVGDIQCHDGDLESAQRLLAAQVDALLAAGHFPLLFGGGHEIAWGSFQGIAKALERDGRLPRLGIVNFDAHFDLRRPTLSGRSTSGTPFFQIHEWLQAQQLPFRYLCVGVSAASNTAALFATARATQSTWISDEDLIWPRWDAACSVVDDFLAGVDALQVSICLDVLPAASAPGVSAPAGRGVAPDLLFALLSHLLDRAQHGTPDSKVVLAEIAELSPPLDPDGRTARLAARIAQDIAAPLV